MTVLTTVGLKGLTQDEIDQRAFDLHDEYCHGRVAWRPRCQEAAARPSWERTVAFFKMNVA